jgi:hypothetical protein
LKKSAFVKLGLTTAVALSLRCGGGPRQEAQRCVDGTGRVVEDRYCEHPGAPAVYYPYHWYYGGSGYFPGMTASGGRTDLTPGRTAVRTSSPGFAESVARGGFGGSAEGGAGE